MCLDLALRPGCYRQEMACIAGMTKPDNAILWPTALASKSLSSAEQCYSNRKCEAMEILHWLEKFHHYWFADHKPLVAIWTQMWQCYHSGYNASYYKYTSTGCASYTSLAQNYTLWTGFPTTTTVRTDKEIEGMMNMNAICVSINITVCRSIWDI